MKQNLLVPVAGVLNVNVSISSLRVADKVQASVFEDNPFSASPAPSSASVKRLQLESVIIPVRRSKLSTEKTASKDNLTLEPVSPSKLGRGSSQVLTSDPVDEVEEEDDRNPNDYQPFTIGINKAIRQEDISTLDLNGVDYKRKGRGKGKATAKGKGKAKAMTPPDSEDEEEPWEDVADEDFAMDSEGEERQLKRAIKASKAVARKGQATARSKRANMPIRAEGESADSIPTNSAKVALNLLEI
jgi:hypothetical protein